MIILYTTLQGLVAVQISSHSQWSTSSHLINFIEFSYFLFILKETSIFEMITYISVTILTIKILFLRIMTDLITGKNTLLIDALLIRMLNFIKFIFKSFESKLIPNKFKTKSLILFPHRIQLGFKRRILFRLL